MRVLIVKTSALGDIIHCFPVLDYLVAKGCEVHWIAEAAGATILNRHPHVARTYSVNTKQWRKAPWSQEVRSFLSALRELRYDLVIDLQGNIKSALFTLFAKAGLKIGLGRHSVVEWPNLLVTQKKYEPSASGHNVREDYLSVVQQHFVDESQIVEQLPVQLRLTSDEKAALLQLGDLASTVIVAPGSRWPNKELSLDGMCALLEKEIDQHSPLLVTWGGERERLLAEQVVARFARRAKLLGQVSLPLLQNIMAQCQRVVAMDSLPLHLAASTGVATLSVFGPSSMKKYAPIGPQHRAFQMKCPYQVTFEKRCPKLRTCKTGACLKT